MNEHDAPFRTSRIRRDNDYIGKVKVAADVLDGRRLGVELAATRVKVNTAQEYGRHLRYLTTAVSLVVTTLLGRDVLVHWHVKEPLNL